MWDQQIVTTPDTNTYFRVFWERRGKEKMFTSLSPHLDCNKPLQGSKLILRFHPELYCLSHSICLKPNWMNQCLDQWTSICFFLSHSLFSSLQSNFPSLAGFYLLFSSLPSIFLALPDYEKNWGIIEVREYKVLLVSDCQCFPFLWLQEFLLAFLVVVVRERPPRWP